MANLNKIKGALYGVAVGDALGGPLEFMSRREVLRAYPRGLRDMVGGGWLNLRPGETTDDTAMTLGVARAIAKDDRANLVGDIGREFIAWYKSNPPDIGNTCRAAIYGAMATFQREPLAAPEAVWPSVAMSLGQNQEGNGALMRNVYPGLWAKSQVEAEELAELHARMTHNGDISASYCRLYASWVWALVDGGLPDLTKPRFAKRHLADWSPSGYVVDTMDGVMQAVLGEANFEDTVAHAVNLGGDADTVGAIAGGLAGAMYGFDAIPRLWLDELGPALCAELDQLALAAYEHRK